MPALTLLQFTSSSNMTVSLLSCICIQHTQLRPLSLSNPVQYWISEVFKTARGVYIIYIYICTEVMGVWTCTACLVLVLLILGTGMRFFVAFLFAVKGCEFKVWQFSFSLESTAVRFLYISVNSVINLHRTWVHQIFFIIALAHPNLYVDVCTV
jgi:hypothetical protein